MADREGRSESVTDSDAGQTHGQKNLRQWKRRVVWEPDDEAFECRVCESDFSTTRRKHHCRQCGRVVCGSCSEQEKKVAGYDGPQRVCSECYSKPETQTLGDRCNELMEVGTNVGWAVRTYCPQAQDMVRIDRGTNVGA